jgi:hypothetical protein
VIDFICEFHVKLITSSEICQWKNQWRQFLVISLIRMTARKKKKNVEYVTHIICLILFDVRH